MKTKTHAALVLLLPLLAGAASGQNRPRLSVEFQLQEKSFAAFYRPDGVDGPGASLAEVQSDLSARLAAALQLRFGYLEIAAAPPAQPAPHLSIVLTSEVPERRDSTIVESFFELHLAGASPRRMRLAFRDADRYVNTETSAESLKEEIDDRFRKRLDSHRDALVREMFSCISLGRSAFLHVLSTDERQVVVPFSFCQLRTAPNSWFLLETEDDNDRHYHGIQASSSPSDRIPGLPPLFSGGIKMREFGSAVPSHLQHTAMNGLGQTSGELTSVVAVYVVHYFPQLDESGCTPANLQL